MKRNIDPATVASFGDEWSRFDQTAMSDDEANAIFEEYFAVFPWQSLPEHAIGFDMGCGSGRWARLMAPKVGHLHCIEPSAALVVARKALSNIGNVSFHEASVDDEALPAGSQDFGYSLGVLHHIPDTAAAIESCVSMLKPGAPFLLYLYYALDNRPVLFRAVWRMSNAIRTLINRLPAGLKHAVTDAIALLVYFPLALLSRMFERLGFDVSNIPLSYYRNHSWYTMRTDSRDRFGTPLEQRFTKAQIVDMMQAAGLSRIVFSDKAPFWCAVGYRQ
jgi:SAM-dependent methyltransferase